MANPFTVQPLGGLQNLQMINQGMQGIGENFQAQQEKERKQALMQQAGDIMERGNPQEIARFRMANPEIGEAMTSGIQFANEATERNMQDSMQRIIAGQDPAQVIQDRVAMVESQGGDATQSLAELQRLQEMGPDQYRKMVSNIYQMRYGDGIPGGSGPSIGTYNPRDYTTESFAEFQQTNDPSVLQRYEGQRSVEIGGVPHVFDPARGGYYPATVGGGQGDTEVTTESVASSQGEIAATEDARKQAIKKSGEAAEKLSTARAAIPLYDRAIELVRNGANTGALVSRFPTLTESGAQLDDIQRQLGLNVLQNTTFGALSEGELRLALQAGLPTSMEGEDLIKELERRKEAQQKLARYLEDATIFLGDPKNTPADWAALQKQRRQESSKRANQAPQSAIDYLKANPNMADQFKQKYGYLPEGF